MKFKLLSIGQKFEYEGEMYIKTSPLVASNVKTSHNKMIPRYATLTLHDETGRQASETKDELVSAEHVLTQFDHFYEKCINLLEHNNMLLPLIKDELDKARDEFTSQFK